ncbi:hypothetical protein DFH09DRAFT_1134731, partial [Mycena vulgaris]
STRLRGFNDGSGKFRFVVETLLIPKQHATTDTCTMDEEEGVLGFTEERALITLDCIRTHPAQSFQRMLPESFAVVCAPKSDSKYQAFHPHPDDADRGHVQMREAALEIVDLR